MAEGTSDYRCDLNQQLSHAWHNFEPSIGRFMVPSRARVIVRDAATGVPYAPAPTAARTGARWATKHLNLSRSGFIIKIIYDDIMERCVDNIPVECKSLATGVVCGHYIALQNT